MLSFVFTYSLTDPWCSDTRADFKVLGFSATRGKGFSRLAKLGATLTSALLFCFFKDGARLPLLGDGPCLELLREGAPFGLQFGEAEIGPLALFFGDTGPLNKLLRAASNDL